MPTRRRDRDDEDRIERKITKLKRNLNKKRRKSRFSTTSPEPPVESVEVETDDCADLTVVDSLIAEQNQDENIIPTLDESILSALGNTFNTDKVYGEDIHPEIMKRFENILTCGLKKEIKEEIIKKYLIPANGKLLDAPKLNVELQGLLTELVKARDKKVEERQQQLGTALATISYIMDTLVKGNFNKINTITILTDVTKLLSDLHWEDTVTRRKLIAANLDKNIVKSVDSSIRYSFLFGEKFNENVKSANAIKKSAASILKPSNINTQKPNNKNRSHGIQLLGNYQGPPRQGQYKQGGGEGRYQQRTSVRLQQRRPAAKAYHPARRPVRQS